MAKPRTSPLTRAMKRKGISDIWLAEELCVNPSTIWRWRQVDSPPPRVDTAQLIAARLGCRVSYLWPVIKD